MRILALWVLMSGPALGQQFVVENKIAAPNEPAPAFVVENKITPATPVPKVQIDWNLGALAATPVQLYKSPLGFHRHVLADGTVIEHADTNNWKPGAHEGMQGTYQVLDGTFRTPKYDGPCPPGVNCQPSSATGRWLRR